MFCKSPRFASFFIVSNATVCAEDAMIPKGQKAFKSLASTNSAMPAPFGFTGFSAIRATDVLQIDRRVLQIAGIASVRNVAMPTYGP
jgi:hypothetical protein